MGEHVLCEVLSTSAREGTLRIVRFPDPPYGVGREKEPPRSWEKNFEAT